MAETTRFPVKKGSAAPAETGHTSFDLLRREMDRLFEDFGRGFLPFTTRFGMPEMEPFWREGGRGLEPSVDILEQPDRYQITAELPGMDEKNVEVTLSNGTLIIKGEKKEEREEKEANYHISERRFGSFVRSFRLPESTDPDKIEANFKNGVLTIALPKKDEAKKEKKVEIKAA